MTFIEMLQQGGYILPQYSSGQQSYQAPNTGMQALSTMMQIDQGAQQRYAQGEQLNLAKSQNTQNIINSTIQNELNRKTQERLQKQMDLSNQKLEFDMQKAILKDIDEERAKLNSMFLLRDRLQIEKDLADQGLDEAGILEGMKGDLSFDNYSKFQLKRQSLLSKQKNGFTNMQTYSQGSKLLEKTDAELKRAHELMKVGALDGAAYEKYLQDSKEAAAELIKFQNGDVPNIDFKDSKWSGIMGATDFLDEAQMTYQIDMSNKLSNQKLQNEMLESQQKTFDLQSDIALQPITQMKKSLEALGDISKNFGLINGLKQWGINRNPSDIQGILEDINKLSPEQMQGIADMFEAERLKQSQAKDPNLSVAELYTKSYLIGDEDGMQAAMDFQKANNNKTTDVTYTSDSNGKQGITDSKGVTDWGGYRTKGNEFIDGVFGGLPVSLENPAHKKLFEEGKVVFKNGKLRIKGNTVVKNLFGVSQSWDDFWQINDSVIEKAIPGIKKDGEYWEVPYDNKALPAPPATNSDIIIPKREGTKIPADAAKVL